MLAVSALGAFAAAAVALRSRAPKESEVRPGPHAGEAGRGGQHRRNWREWPVWISLAVFSVLTLLAAILAIGRAHSSYDAVAMWIVKGYSIAHEGSIFGAQVWGALGWACCSLPRFL
jgi:hypothetical protein